LLQISDKYFDRNKEVPYNEMIKGLQQEAASRKKEGGHRNG
jgi:hypothetical protein